MQISKILITTSDSGLCFVAVTPVAIISGLNKIFCLDVIKIGV